MLHVVDINFASDEPHIIRGCTPGDIFSLSIPDNPSTGYQWGVESLPQGLVVGLDGDYTPTNSDPQVVGGGGQLTFSCVMRREIADALVLAHYRAWDYQHSVRRVSIRFEA
jgi:predicted secreted protein